MNSYNTRFSCKMTYAILKARTHYESLNVRLLGAKEREMRMNDHQLKKLYIANQILLVSTLTNI